jgi:hypothetical protein
MAPKTGYTADLYVTATPSLVMTGEASASPDLTTYTISNAAKRYWDDSAAVTYRTSTNGGTSWTGYLPTNLAAAGATPLAQCVGGKIIFSAAQPAATILQVSGNYFPFSQCGQGHEWSLDVDSDLLDSTMFQSAWKQYTATEHFASIKFARYFLDGYFFQAINSGAKIVVIAYVDATALTRYDFFAFAKTDSIKADVKGLVEESLTLTATGNVYFTP